MSETSAPSGKRLKRDDPMEIIRRDGLQKAFGEALRKCLWDVRGNVELANKDCFKQFPKALKAIRADLDEAELFYREYRKYGRK